MTTSYFNLLETLWSKLLRQSQKFVLQVNKRLDWCRKEDFFVWTRIKHDRSHENIPRNRLHGRKNKGHRLRGNQIQLHNHVSDAIRWVFAVISPDYKSPVIKLKGYKTDSKCIHIKVCFSYILSTNLGKDSNTWHFDSCHSLHFCFRATKTLHYPAAQTIRKIRSTWNIVCCLLPISVHPHIQGTVLAERESSFSLVHLHGGAAGVQ